MIDDTFIDFYELLKIECDAPDEVVERRFREFAQQPHPGPADAEKIETFSRSMEAYETLTDLELRAAYDIVYEDQKHEQLELLEETSCIEDDTVQRHRLLSFFYAKRRKSMETPGIGGETLFELAKIPKNVLNFHLWYFKENGWLKREENGMLAITASGVDKIESRVEAHLVENPATKNARSAGDEPSQASDKALETVGTEDPS